MLYMMEWRVATDTYDKAHSRFLEGAGALPEGATLLGRWHGPGSGHGWLVVETDKPETCRRMGRRPYFRHHTRLHRRTSGCIKR